MPPNSSRTVFVANIPFDVSEEQLVGIFSDVGPVSGVEIKFDPQTGRSKGYAFIQYYDENTAASAVRNLKDVMVNGRALRVESSTEEPGPRQRQRGGRSPPPLGPGPGPGPGMGMGGPPGRGEPAFPPGVDLPRGLKAADSISKTLATISPGQLQEVMSDMKMLVATQPDQARTLLASKPQLAYALFQAMLLMNIVDPAVLQRIQPQAAPAPPPSMYPSQAPPSIPPPQQAPPAAYPQYGGGAPSYPPFPPAAGAAPPPPAPYSRGGYPSANGGGYAPPAPGPPPMHAPPPVGPSASSIAAAQAKLAAANLPADQTAMIMQVLQLTPEQIGQLDENHKQSVIALRQQFLS